MKTHNNKDEDLKLLIELAQGDEEFIREMLGIFIKVAPQTMSSINEGLKNKDLSSVSDAAHKLKSSIQIVGDQDLHKLIKEIEQKAKNEDSFSSLSTLIENLNKRMDKLINSLRDRSIDPTKFT